MLGNRAYFLSGSHQRSVSHRFVKALPWTGLARKNIGYLFAIAYGAKVIWDFDDSVQLKFWLQGASPDLSLEIDSYLNADTIAKAEMGVQIPTSEKNNLSEKQPLNILPLLRSGNFKKHTCFEVLRNSHPSVSRHIYGKAISF